MPGFELVQAFLHQASAQGSRSTALSPLGWLVAIICSALVGSLWKAPAWMIVCLLVVLLLCVGMYAIAYFYFMLKSPDALRSEKFTLSKMAIERSRIGDDRAGFTDPTDQPNDLPAGGEPGLLEQD